MLWAHRLPSQVCSEATDGGKGTVLALSGSIPAMDSFGMGQKIPDYATVEPSLRAASILGL